MAPVCLLGVELIAHKKNSVRQVKFPAHPLSDVHSWRQVPHVETCFNSVGPQERGEALDPGRMSIVSFCIANKDTYRARRLLARFATITNIGGSKISLKPRIDEIVKHEHPK